MSYEAVTIRLPQDEKQALEQLAAAGDRPLASLIRRILSNHLKQETKIEAA